MAAQAVALPATGSGDEGDIRVLSLSLGEAGEKAGRFEQRMDLDLNRSTSGALANRRDMLFAQAKEEETVMTMKLARHAALIGATRRGRPLAQLGAGQALVGLLATITRLGAPLNLRFACKWWVPGTKTNARTLLSMSRLALRLKMALGGMLSWMKLRLRCCNQRLLYSGTS